MAEQASTQPPKKKRNRRVQKPSDRRRARERGPVKVRLARQLAIRKDPSLAKPDELAPPGTPPELRGLMHPKMVAGRWKPGQSGNPAGKPQTPTLEEVLREHLSGREDGSEDTRLQAMAKEIYTEGVGNHNSKVLIAIMDRLYPKPLKIIGDADQPIVIAEVVRRIVE